MLTKQNFSFVKFVLIIAIISAFGIVFGVAGYLMTNKPILISPPQISASPEPTVSVKDETADWRTYSNEKYGFELKYPTSLYVMLDPAADNIIDFSEYKNPPAREYQGIRIQIDNFSGDFKGYIDETVKNDLKSSNDIYGCNNSIADISREELNMDGTGGIMLKGFCGPENIAVFAVKGNKLYSISNTYSDDMLFGKILSTFKFINR